NAVLRRATREPDYSPSANISNPIERIAIETSHPRWLIERWSRAFGIEHTESFARANNETPVTALRVVASAGDEERVLEQLRSAGATLSRSAVTTGAWRVSGATAKARELAEIGAIHIQDEASQLVAEGVNAQRGDRVLDVCAAPGGKTTLIAERAQGGLVLAMDASERRLSTVAQTVELHRLNNVRLMTVGAREPPPFPIQSFDRVLVDAPCSGTGTLRHNPEIRWRISLQDIERLALQQTEILQQAARMVRPGGRLVYSTCSVETEENEDVVKVFRDRNSEFQPMVLQNPVAELGPSGAL